jgi:hypothetical protein
MPADEEANWSLIDFARQVAAMPATTPEANYVSIEPTPVSDKSTAALTPANDSNGFSENPQPISKERDADPPFCKTRSPLKLLSQELPG